MLYKGRVFRVNNRNNVKSEQRSWVWIENAQNLQPLLALLKNSPMICAFLANQALAVDICLQLHFIKDAKLFLLFIINTAHIEHSITDLIY